jgi:hypothetical protein
VADNEASARPYPNDDRVYNLRNIESVPPLTATIKVNRIPIRFEIDTGSGVMIILMSTAKHLWPDGYQMAPADKKLHTYSGQALEVRGKVTVSAMFRSKCK